MKTPRLKITLLAALTAAALAPSVSRAASDITIQPTGATTMSAGSGNQTSSSGGGGVWQNWYVNVPPIAYNINFDTTTLPSPNPSAATGSMLQQQSWDGSGGGSMITFACIDGNFWGGASFDASQYQSVELDFKYDTTSTMTPASAAHVEVHLDNHFLPAGGSDGVTLTNLQNSGSTAGLFDGAWHHVSVGINPATAPTQSKGPGFKIYNPSSVSGTFNYWTANIKLVANPVATPPPTISLDKARPGLRQFGDVTPSYNRQDIRTDTTPPGSKNIDWVGHPGATYSWTVVDFPGAANPNFQIALALTPDDPTGMTYADADWSATNCLWLQIQGNADGSVRSSLAWKTNQPAGNSQMYSASLGQLYQNFNTPTAIGTWSLSFPNDTTAVLTAPGGMSTTATLPPDMFIVPYNNISCYLMTGMNNYDALVGQSVTLSAFNITGVVNPVNEDLTDGGLSSPFLTLQSQQYGQNPTPVNQTFVQSSDAYWLHWTLPDNNYFLVEKTTLQDAFWLDYSLNAPFINGGGRWGLVSKAALPNPSTSYFALQQRTNSQMQVLFDWETPAPNTLTGKTGTQPAGSVSLANSPSVNITVRAVDSHFNLIPTTDTVTIGCSDGTAGLPGASVTLVGGVGVFNGLNVLTFGSTGTFTVYATNTSKAFLPVGASSSVIVVP